MRGRFAPSPTGDLHLGGAFVAVASCLRVRASESRHDAAYVVRVEDLDPPRVVAGSEDRIFDDLAWLGIVSDEDPRRGGPYAPYRQSKRDEIYRAAIAALEAQGSVYPCTCSRAEIARASSAPHEGEEGPRYPGTCRDPARRRTDRAPCWRLRVPEDAAIAFDDLARGHVEQDVAATVGDFVIRRADGAWGYQLAVVVDDLAMRIQEVVRGDDLLLSTPRQLLLARMLREAGFLADRDPPKFAHVPVVRGPDGHRLAKRHQSRWVGSTIAELRGSGVEAGEILGEIGAAWALCDRGDRLEMSDLVARAASRSIDLSRAWTPPDRWLRRRDR